MAANSYGFDFLRAEHNLSSAADDGSVGGADWHRPTLNGDDDGDDDDDDDANDDDDDDNAATTTAVDAKLLDVSHKSDLEKQADILLFLRHHRSSGCLPPSVIRKALGIDLSENTGTDGAVADMLRANPKVNVEEVPDPENPSLSMTLYGYRAKFSDVRDRRTLLARINRMKNGIRWNDLADAYDGVEDDLHKLLTGGEVLGVPNPEEKDRILFPRGECFLVELDGCVAIPEATAVTTATATATTSTTLTTTTSATTTTTEPPTADGASVLASSAVIDPDNAASAAGILLPDQARRRHHVRTRLICTDVDPRTQIRRGEAIRVGGEWRRVSSEIRPDLPVSKQPPRAQAPLSVVSLKDLSRKNDVDGYCRKFDGSTIPLDGPLEEHLGLANLERARAAREGLRAIANGGSGGSAGGTIRGPTSAGALLSSFASEKDPSVLVNHFAKGVAASFGIGRGGGGAGGAEGIGDGDGHRKRPTARVSARRPGDGGAGARGLSGGVGGAGKGRGTIDAEAVKAAVEDARRMASDPYLSYSHAVRHGCTKDVREMYLETLSSIPVSDVDLHRALLEHKLIEPGESMARQRMKRKNNVDNDGKPKKRRYYERKNMRRTNTHLDGTEIGAMLAMAAEKQARGNAVGDGGM
jgi:hypothetical protein